MDYSSSIPFTSIAGIGGGLALTGVALEQLWAVGVAVTVVAIAAAEIRYRFRRGKQAEEA